ncbi:MAG TPA: type II and III secretion system protein family protein [Terriglobales bacterium]|nr:type II and III secretion system protein family protein [Terriglobales bacterium]
MKITQRLPQRIAMIILLCAIAAATTQDQAPAPQPTSPVQAAPAQSEAQGLAASSQNPPSETTGAAPLRVMVGKSLLINTTERLKRVSVTDPAIADPQVVSPTQILIHGRAPGEVSLLIWDELERSRSFDLRVDVDVSAAAEEEKRVFPDEQITVTPSRSAIVLSGHVSDEEVAKRAGMIAEAYSHNVVNVLTFGPVGAQEVMLEVKFAEVDRSAMLQLGVNFFSTGAANTIGTVTTGQFGGFGPQQITQPTGQAVTPPFNSNQTISNLLNLFVFRPDIHLGAVIQALQNKNVLQILAEPNLIAVNGKEASFLAGGEFPFPIVQPGQGFTAVTIQFKEFGVKLKFTPLIEPNGNIHLRVVPEVSTLDFANSLTISGFTIPALSTRRAETEFELQDGQSFVIAGLMDNRVTNIVNKIPGLGDIPILGNFFKSKSAQKSNSELMVLCTARRVSPNAQPPATPANPLPMLDKDKFDGKKPSGDGK